MIFQVIVIWFIGFISVTLFIPLLFIHFNYTPQALAKFLTSHYKTYYVIGGIWGIITHLTIYLAMTTCSHDFNTQGFEFSKFYSVISFGLILFINLLAMTALAHDKTERNQLDTKPLAVVFGYQIMFGILMIVPNFFIQILLMSFSNLADCVINFFEKIYLPIGSYSNIKRSITDTDFSLTSRLIQGLFYLFSYLNLRIFTVKNFDR